MQKRLRAVLAALLLAAVCLPAAADAAPALIRLHVIAASDSEADQAEKLLARDAVLAETDALLAGCENCAEAYRVLDERLADVEAAALAVLPGRDVRADLTREYYPERIYGGLRVPEGEYDSLKVTIGAGEGHNWWCVVYPSLCRLAEEPESAPVLAQAAPSAERPPQSFWEWLFSLFAGERADHA